MLDKDIWFSKIITVVRDACEKIGITQGAIGVAIEPKRSYYETMFSVPTLASYDISIASVNRESGDTLCYEDGKIVGDCAGVVCMKIAATRQMLKYKEQHLIPIVCKKELTSGDVPAELDGIGLTHWKGCVAIPIGCLTGGGCAFRGEGAMTIYVAVSGGKQEQDEEAAWTALKVILELIEEDGLMVHRALYNDD